jgi:hypothetical protein
MVDMANEFKYKNQVWGATTPIAGERLSTNGYYTGEQRGTAIQDALVDGTTAAKLAESNAVHIGTVLQDAIADSTPDVEA